MSVGFGPNSETGGGTVRFWDANGLLAIGDEVPLAEGVARIWVDGSGSYAMQLLVDSKPNSPPIAVIVWDLTPKSWMRMACDLAGRPLNRVEWRKLLPDRPYDPACRS